MLNIAALLLQFIYGENDIRNPDQVQPKTIKLVFVVFSIGAEHYGERTKLD